MEYNVVHPTARIHSTAVIGAEGLKITVDDFGDWHHFKHLGSVVIGAHVRVGAHTVIHRSCDKSTVIGEWTAIGALCSIGHNVVIGEKCILTAGITIGGSAVIGDGCFIGIGATIRDHVRICDGVRVGMGSVVVKDILEPGVYYNGVRKGDWDGSWKSQKQGGKQRAEEQYEPLPEPDRDLVSTLNDAITFEGALDDFFRNIPDKFIEFLDRDAIYESICRKKEVAGRERLNYDYWMGKRSCNNGNRRV